jgi:hypothetical protein
LVRKCGFHETARAVGISSAVFQNRITLTAASRLRNAAIWARPMFQSPYSRVISILNEGNLSDVLSMAHIQRVIERSQESSAARFDC